MARCVTYALHRILNNCAYFWVACESGGTLSMDDARPVGMVVNNFQRSPVHTPGIPAAMKGVKDTSKEDCYEGIPIDLNLSLTSFALSPTTGQWLCIYFYFYFTNTHHRRAMCQL